MGFIFGLIKRLIKFALYFAILVAVVTLIPNLPPYTKFSTIEVSPTLPRTGALQDNNILNKAEKLYKDKLSGPEGFAIYNGEVYTTLGSGEVVKLSPGGHVTYVTKFGEPCHAPNEPLCGRPLGIDVDEKTGQLYVADAYYGIYKVDPKTDKKQLLVSPRVEINGRVPKLFNSVAVDKNGDFYWADSCSDFPLIKGVQIMLADPSGRLFHYSASTNKSRVLLDDLWMANGVAISPDSQFVLVSESGRQRIMKYYVDGAKKGKSEVFIDGLPGTPDNLRALPDGSGVQIAFYLVFDENLPFIGTSLAKTPIIRKFVARMLTLAEMPFEFLNQHFPSAALRNIAHNIASFKSFSALMPQKSGLVIADWNGKIIESYFNNDASAAHISDAIVFQDKLYMGSPHLQDYVAAVPAPALLKKAFANVKTTPPPKTAETVTRPKPVEEKVAPKVVKPVAEKPTTTTPKPTTTTTTTPKPTTTTQKPTTTTQKPTTSTQKPTTTTQKPTTTTQKPTTTTQKPTTTTQTPTTTTQKPAPKVEKPQKPKEAIPIKEEIPSDTAKPTKEKLKVIKKGGPAEIPIPV